MKIDQINQEGDKIDNRKRFTYYEISHKQK
jgi:hypothetical protein